MQNSPLKTFEEQCTADGALKPLYDTLTLTGAALYAAELERGILLAQGSEASPDASLEADRTSYNAALDALVAACALQGIEVPEFDPVDLRQLVRP
jgi:hypothetical protein